MEEDPAFLCYLCNLFNRLDGPHFIVGVHDGNKNGPGSDGFLNFIRINPSIAIHADTRHCRPEFFKKTARIEDGGMFYLCRDDVVAFLP